MNKKSGWKFPGVFLILCFEIHFPILSNTNCHFFRILKSEFQDSNPFPAIHDNCCLLRHLLFAFEACIANNMNPDRTAPKSDQGS